MIKKIAIAILLILFSALSAFPAAKINTNKMPSHYAREMEFYYQKPRPAIINGLLRSFDQNGTLNSSENRLMLAAFLSELILSEQINFQNLIEEAKELGPFTRQTLAWVSHLANAPDENQILETLLDDRSKSLKAQIEHSPTRLLDWNPGAEKSILQMFWAAFMASGNSAYIDRIIETALSCSADNPNQSKKVNKNMCLQAAASLYDLTPSHPQIRKRLMLFDSYGYAKDILTPLLLHANN